MGRIESLLLIGLIAWSPLGAGQTSCFPDFTALDVVENVDVASPSAPFLHFLKAKSGERFFTSKAQVVGQVNADGQLDLHFRFDPDFDGVSLPYNLFGVSITSLSGEVLFEQDFTEGCRAAGVGFFPGAIVTIPTLKFHDADTRALQIRIWGRI